MRRISIKPLDKKNPTSIGGIVYYLPASDAYLEGRDGRASIRFNSIPVPLEELDYRKLEGGVPDYDMVGKGLYLALRSNPDCSFNDVYAGWLRDAYPHYLAELANLIVMLDRKDVEVGYLDRKINYLKVMALLEPDNPGFPAAIGATLLDRGLRLSALQQTTVMLYRAESFLMKSLALSPDTPQVRSDLAEVKYLLGRYDEADRIWGELLPSLEGTGAEHLEQRRINIRNGKLPKVPPVDYLEAIGVAFASYQAEDFEECAAILNDILDDPAFRDEFPLPEVWYYLGLSYQNMAMPRNAKECFVEAVTKNPAYAEAKSALESLSP